MTGWHIWVAVAGGGALGAMLRHGVNILAFRLLGPNFPWGTLTANALGSFCMGLVVIWLSRHEPNPIELRAFLSVGVLGAFTTFSTFALDTVTLYREKAIMIAAVYLGASLLLSIGGLAAGLFAGRTFL